MIRAALALALVLAVPLAEPGLRAQEAVEAPGAVLRVLDKMANLTEDLEVANGDGVQVGPLAVAVSDCRTPADNPSADAFAHLTITDPAGSRLFDGWMLASSPALSALDHPRYDVWVLRCISTAG